MLLYCWACDFYGLKVSQGKERTINRWGSILNHLSMAYLLSNSCTKNYRNQTTIVKIIVGGWPISDTVYRNTCCHDPYHHFIGRPFVKRFAVCYRIVVLSVCPVLSETLVYCGQTVGWTKMKLGVQVGLGPGHIVLDGDPAPLPPKGHNAASNFRPISVAAKWLHGSRCHLVWK